MDKIIKKVKKVGGTIDLPGDRSISHRSLILSSLADGTSVIRNCSNALECESTKTCLKQMGVEISGDVERLEVAGLGIDGLMKPDSPLNVNNSAAALSLLTGILSGFGFDVEIQGNEALSRRPFKRLIQHLEKMGAKIDSNDYKLPFIIHGSHLIGTDFNFPSPNPHTKSSLLFAGLKAEGETVISESISSRDHTERMISNFGIPIELQAAKQEQDTDELDRRM
ncbi:MAG: 3-phosphoshikimate 1-carboxyvinyltransferase, partial [candidate division Zixibacteria bacterium]|nr:3-phosphoshikimate 1-carboxyvinyltransferase [candidate division Zixibacteria bacterium]